MKVVLTAGMLSEGEVTRIYEAEKRASHLTSRRCKAKPFFVHTYDIVQLQSAVVLVKEYLAQSLQMVNLREFRE